MKQLIGQSFSLGEGQYRVVDVRRLNGESLVYAEDQRAADTRSGAAQPVSAASHPQRMAFHYSDIADLLGNVDNKTA